MEVDFLWWLLLLLLLIPLTHCSDGRFLLQLLLLVVQRLRPLFLPHPQAPPPHRSILLYH